MSTPHSRAIEVLIRRRLERIEQFTALATERLLELEARDEAAAVQDVDAAEVEMAEPAVPATTSAAAEAVMDSAITIARQIEPGRHGWGSYGETRQNLPTISVKR